MKPRSAGYVKRMRQEREIPLATMGSRSNDSSKLPPVI